MSADVAWALMAGAGAFAATALVAFVLGHRLDRRSRHAVIAIAQVSGVLAMFAGERPTAITWMNLALAGLLGALVPLAASRATPAVCVGGAVVAAFATLFPLEVDPAAAALACAALGVGLAVAFTGARAPVVRALVGALLVHGALRLGWPSTVGARSVVAALILVPILVVGWRRAPTRVRRVAAWASAAAGALVVLAGAGAAMTVLQARSALDRGVAAAERGLDAVSASRRDDAGPALGDALAEFRSIRKSLSGPLARPALLVPVLSQHVRTAHDVADRATAVLDAAVTANEVADPAKLRFVQGAVDIGALKALRRPLFELSASLARLSTVIDDARSPWLAGPLVEKLDELDVKVVRASDSARVASQAVERAPAMLGETGTRRYFIAVMTPSELRGSGGLIGNYAVIEATGGRVSLTRIGRDSELITQGTPVAERSLTGADPEWVARYGNVNPQGWLNVTYGPDWTVTARAISVLYPQSGGGAVDGVIGVDPEAMAAILRLTGPIKVPDWPDPITADNAERIMLFEQYVRFQDNAARIGFLGEVAAELWSSLLRINPEPSKLADVFGAAARAGHMKMWARDTGEQGLLSELEIDAAFPKVHGDFLAVIGNSTSANKIDWFTRRAISYQVDVDARSGAASAVVEVKVTNTAPASGLPDYILGAVGRTRTSPGYAHVFQDVSIYSPLKATSMEVDGKVVGLRTASELGREVVTTFVDVAPGATVTVRAKLEGRLKLSERYSLDVFRQVMTTPDQITARVTVDEGFADTTFEASRQRVTWTFPEERAVRSDVLGRVRAGHLAR